MPAVSPPSPGDNILPFSSFTKYLLFLLAYCVFAYLSLELTVAGKPASPVWPASGIALAAILLLGYRAGLVAFVGGVWITLVRDFVLLPGLLSGLGAALEALAAAWMLRRLGFGNSLSNVRDVMLLLLVAMLAAVFSPSIGLTGYANVGLASWHDYGRSWYVWWLGDILGMLIFTPFLLAWCRRPPYVKDWLGAAMLALVYVGAIAITVSIFGPYMPMLGLTQEAAFLLYPLLIWAALRYRLRDVSALMILVALVSSYGTAMGYGPFAFPGRMAMDELAFFLIVTSVIVLAFNASSATVLRGQRDLQRANETMTSLIEALPDAIFFKDGLGRWQVTNEPAKRLFRLQGYDWQGKTDADMARERSYMRLVHEGCIAGDEVAWQNGKLTVVSEFVKDDAGMEHEYEVRKVPIYQNDGRRKGMVIIGQDITARRKLERGLVKVTEYQQRSIGQDLHDNVGQRLTGIAFLAKVLEQNLRGRALPEAEEARLIVSQVNEAIAETKNLARGLMPVELEANGLVAALDAYCQRVTATYRVDCSFECHGETVLHSQHQALNLLRIAQEAVSNAIRHGRADSIRVRLQRQGPHLELSVEDNGSGFAAEPAAPAGMGLETMHYRASLIGARLQILPRSEGGVAVHLTMERAE